MHHRSLDDWGIDEEQPLKVIDKAIDDLSFSSIKDLRRVGLLTNLKHLVLLGRRQLRGITRLTSFTHLDLSYCLALEDLHLFSTLVNLEWLSLHASDGFKGIGSLISLINLACLDLHYTCFDNENTARWLNSRLPRLRVLTFKDSVFYRKSSSTKHPAKHRTHGT